ncbi:MAG TPA: hypothetical protein VFD58_31680 [Blastocatellia bacterium]|nr:hypothetical protein [Blastocatellia bacterium]
MSKRDVKSQKRLRRIQLETLLESYKRKEKSFTDVFPPEQELYLEKIPDNPITPDTPLTFTIEGKGFGRLECRYTPQQETVGRLASNFNRIIPEDPLGIVKCTDGALGILLRKIAVNLEDAMNGLIRETLYETIRELNGREVFGIIKHKEWRKEITAWHAKASKMRIDGNSGPQINPTDFVKAVQAGAIKTSGKITQEKLAEAMGISVRGLQERVKNNRYTWKAVLDMCDLAKNSISGDR